MCEVGPRTFLLLVFGLLGVAPRSYAPHAQILLLYYSPLLYYRIKI